MVSTSRRAAAALYLALTIAVAVAAWDSPAFLAPAPLLALVVAPMALVALFAAEWAAGLLWILGITNANPDGYDDRWVLPLVVLAAAVNAAAYIWLAMRYARRRS